MTLTESQPTTPIEPAADHAPGDREMTMLEHLDELRKRLVASVIAVVAGIVVALIPIPGYGSITEILFHLMAGKAPAGKLVTGGPGEAFFAWLEVSLMIGVALAMPVIIYQLLSFVTPALYENEKKYLLIAVPGVTLSFAIGAAFCFFVMVPVAIAFLGSFQADVFLQLWTAERFIDFIASFIFWVGVTFELPIVMYFLSKLGVVTPQRMGSFRKYAFVLAFLIGAIITPTPDPVNQTLVSLPIYLLSELGIILARFA